MQVLAGLNHPNIVTVHDYGRTADGSFYYAMELLEGMDIEKLVAAGGPQPYATSADLERALAACALTSEWTAERARSWWKRHGGTPKRTDEADG